MKYVYLPPSIHENHTSYPKKNVLTGVLFFVEGAIIILVNEFEFRVFLLRRGTFSFSNLFQYIRFHFYIKHPSLTATKGGIFFAKSVVY